VVPPQFAATQDVFLLAQQDMSEDIGNESQSRHERIRLGPLGSDRDARKGVTDLTTSHQREGEGRLDPTLSEGVLVVYHLS
jgi:hypothetical protein